MNTPLLLYSAGTWLAYTIAERFYGGIHYVWCSPFYDAATAARHLSIPPSSSPAEIYWRLEQDIRRGDRHSSAVTLNRRGVLRGARAQHRSGVITDAEYAEIRKIVSGARIADFRPVLYVIPFDQVQDVVVEAPVAQRAHPLSLEYRVEKLTTGLFDLLELRR